MKKAYLKQRDYQMLLGAFLACVVLNLVASFIPLNLLFLTLPLNLLLFALATGYLIRRDQAYKIYAHDPASNYFQLEALMKLFQVLRFNAPLPQFRHWAVSPDCCVELVRLVMQRQCKTIVECGSGISTLIQAKTLQQLGGGHVYSLDHDDFYAEQTRQMLKLHGLSDFATVITAPLEENEYRGKKYTWYSLKALEQIPSGVDLLFVDGPPSKQSDMRYPALPALKSKFNPLSVVVLDDYLRAGEKQVVKVWLSEEASGQYSKTELETEKGTCILIQDGQPDSP